VRGGFGKRKKNPATLYKPSKKNFQHAFGIPFFGQGSGKKKDAVQTLAEGGLGVKKPTRNPAGLLRKKKNGGGRETCAGGRGGTALKRELFVPPLKKKKSGEGGGWAGGGAKN